VKLHWLLRTGSAAAAAEVQCQQSALKVQKLQQLLVQLQTKWQQRVQLA
jgi:hypothetical protein